MEKILRESWGNKYYLIDLKRDNKKFMNRTRLMSIIIPILIGVTVGQVVTPLFGLPGFWLNLGVSLVLMVVLFVVFDFVVGLFREQLGKGAKLAQLEGLYRLKKEDIPRASQVLADAFAQDPLFVKLFGTHRNSSRLFEKVSLMMVRYCFSMGGAYASSDRLEGVMLISWSPYTQMTIVRIIQSGSIFPLLGMGLGPLWKVVIGLSPLDDLRARHMGGDPYVYLQMIGVAQEHQSKGHGGKMLRALLSGADQAQLPVYLETETEKNVSIYERFEFETVQELTLETIQQPMWLMVRKRKG